MPMKRLLPALLAALLLAAPAMAAEHAPGFEACIKKNPKSSDQKQCLDMERDYWQKKLDTRYQAMQGICKKFSGPEAEKRSTACLEALEESQHSWLAYKASMRPVAENYPNSQSAMENLAWFEIDQLRKRIHDLETLDPSLADKPARRSNTMDDIEKGLSDFGNSMESLFNSGMKKWGWTKTVFDFHKRQGRKASRAPFLPFKAPWPSCDHGKAASPSCPLRDIGTSFCRAGRMACHPSPYLVEASWILCSRCRRTSIFPARRNISLPCSPQTAGCWWSASSPGAM